MGGAPYGLNTPAMSHTGLQVNNVTVLEGVGGHLRMAMSWWGPQGRRGRSHTWGRRATLKPRSRATSAGSRVTRWQLVRAGFLCVGETSYSRGKGRQAKVGHVVREAQASVPTRSSHGTPCAGWTRNHDACACGSAQVSTCVPGSVCRVAWSPALPLCAVRPGPHPAHGDQSQ